MENESTLLDSFSLSRAGRGALDLIRSPKSCLRNMSKGGGYGKPIVYALLWQYAGSVVSLLISFLRPVPVPWGTAGKIILFFLTPPVMLAVGFLMSAFFFVVWHLMGSTQNYQTAFRVWVLFAPLAVLNAIPYVSVAVIPFYVFLLATASVEVHGVRPTKAWTVWGILTASFLILVVLAGVIGSTLGRFPSNRGRSAGSRPPAGMGFPAGDAEKDRAQEGLEQLKKEISSAVSSQNPGPVKK